ncbi:MAG: hypothetical protein SWY16_08800 [Cyanobacteriota bacterium]|nr:hypothetical protein [Cyanobacteriota bacterium]
MCDRPLTSSRPAYPFTIPPSAFSRQLERDRPLLRWNAVTDARSYAVCLHKTGVTLWCRDVETRNQFKNQ